MTSIVRQGVFGSQRWSYWKFFAAAATRYRHSFGTAMTLVIMGYHLQVITRTLSGGSSTADGAPSIQRDLPAETTSQR